MVLQRRLNYGFSGYEVPVVPRASRSPRGRVLTRKKRDNNRIRAIEILACVAGELLQDTGNREEWDNDFENTIKRNQGHNQRYKKDEAKLSKTVSCEQEICVENFTCEFSHVPGLQRHQQSYKVNDFSHARENFGFKTNSTSYFADHRAYVNEKNESGSCFDRVGGHSSNSVEFFRGCVDSVVETKSEAKLYSDKNSFAEGWPYFNGKNASMGPFSKVVRDASQTLDFFRGQVDCVTERKYEAKPSIIQSNKIGIFPVKGSLDTVEVKLKPPSLVRPESNLKTSLFRRWKTCGSFSRRCANVEVDSRDVDESSVCCAQYSRPPPPNIVDQSIRNFSASRHWREAPKLKGGAYHRTDWKRKPAYYNGRPCHTRQRSQRISPYKRRKMFDRIPLCTFDGRFQHKPTFNSPNKRSNGDNCTAANGGSSSAAGQQALLESKSRDCNVKLSIKSFKIPELLIEIPATATIGSLKRAVMEAVTANLGNGLHVGVILQGKSVRDDNKTLLQTGICHDDDHHSLGFILEPNHAPIRSHPHVEDPHLLSGPQGLMRPSDVSPLPPVMNLGSSVDNSFDLVCSLSDISTNNAMPDSQALLTVPAITMEALPVVPLRQKSGHPEFVQRRTRRPFSVSEVEALVQAVEKLGTGRWRDVKLRAFDSAKHRTYVDLKDKWKTLVHTARISPQQRRGEPVPQQLLDRVLAAHAFWSHHQAK